ncbi:hypothetical protein HK405_012315, partial [Cladochytrium tenue]
MHVKQLLAVLAAASVFQASAALAACTKPIVRMEWNQLTKNQKLLYTTIVKKLAARGLTRYLKPSQMGLYDFVSDHTNIANYVHGNAEFYPFHRAMMYLYEQALRSAGWGWGLVYFDWSAVAQNWPSSDVFKYFGGQGDSSVWSCVTDGQFARGHYNVSTDPAFGSYARGYSDDGDQTCLRR